MSCYDFILVFKFKDKLTNPEEFIDKLLANGCDDASIGIGEMGKIAFEFSRESCSAFESVRSALRDIKKSLPEVHLIEASLDLTLIAEEWEII